MKPKFPAILFSSITLALFAAPAAQAVTYYWDNDGTTPGFGTAAGTWAAPTTGSITQGFSQDPAGETTPVDVTTGTGDTMNFGTSSLGLVAGNVSVNGTLRIGGAGRLNSGSYAGAIAIASGSVLSYGSSVAQTLSGVISGLGSITKNTDTTSTLVLSGASIFTGGVTLNAGSGRHRLRQCRQL